MEGTSDQPVREVEHALERIVVAVDGSPHAGIVLEAASRLPFAEGASIVIVHVVRWLGRSSVSYMLLEQRGQQTVAEASAALTRLLAGAPRCPRIETALVFGTPFVEVVRRARAERADLTVIGRHGDRTFLEALIGPTAERVVRKSSSPVLVIRQSAGAYGRPLVAVDLSATCARALAAALRLVARDVVFDLLHVADAESDDAETRSAIASFLAPFDGLRERTNVVIRKGGDPRQILLDEVRTRGSDLIVLGTHGRSAVAQMLIGSVAEAVVRAAPCDVLIAPLETRRYEHP